MGMHIIPPEYILENRFGMQLSRSHMFTQTMGHYTYELLNSAAEKRYERLRNMVEVVIENKRMQSSRNEYIIRPGSISENDSF